MTYNSQSDHLPKTVSFKKFGLKTAMRIPIRAYIKIMHDCVNGRMAKLGFINFLGMFLLGLAHYFHNFCTSLLV